MKRSSPSAEKHSGTTGKKTKRVRSRRTPEAVQTLSEENHSLKLAASAAILLEELDEQKCLLELQNEQLRDAQEELELTRQRYADLYDLAPVGYVTFDARGCIREINETAARMLNYPASHVIGKPMIGYLASGDRKEFLKHLWQCRHSELPIIAILHLVSREGIERTVRIVSHKSREFEKHASWCRSAMLDITEERRAQTDLSASEAKFRLMADNSNEVFWFMDLDPPRLTYVSPAIEQLWGIPVSEVYAQSDIWEKSIHPDDRAVVEQAFQSWIEGKSGEFEQQYRLLARDGKIRWIADRGIVLSRRDGKVCQVSGIARDITERKEAGILRNLLATVVETSSDAIITKDLNGIVTSWNAGAEHIFGYQAVEMVGNPITILIPPERLHDEDIIASRVWKGERIADYVTQRRTKCGRIIDVSISVVPLRDAAGDIIGASKIARDITERLQAEAKFRSLMEAAPDAIIVSNRHGIILLVNTQTENLFGYPRSEIIGQAVEQLVPEAQRNRHQQHRKAFLESPQLTILRNSLDIHGRRKDGSEFPVEISLSPLLTKDELLVISSIRDISERKQAEEQFRGLLESAPDAMVIINQQGSIELINRQTEKVFGYSREELIGQTLEILVPERFRDVHTGHRGRYASSPHARKMGAENELFGRRKDGTEFPAEISLSPLKTKRGTVIISAIRDITDRKQAEERLRLSQRFALSTLEAIPACIAVLDENGTIISTNEVWQTFSKANVGSVMTNGLGANYLAVCGSAIGEEHEEAARFAEGIRDVLNGSLPRFVMEYPCHSPKEERWFLGYVTPFVGEGPKRVVVAHLDISQRKRAEKVIRRLNDELETRVEERTLELKKVNKTLCHEMEARLRLEAEILEISEREQQRIGQDLHDDLGQQLAGIWCLTQAVETSLSDEKSPSAESVSKITGLLKDALALTRALARGLHPVALQSGGVIAALDELTTRTSNMFRVTCTCKCPRQLDLDNTTATHLYRIAQEAVTNAVKHGKSRAIEIELSSNRHQTALSVKDDGNGIPKLDPQYKGMGLRIMNYRADMIGGSLEVQCNPKGKGTIVTCTIPTPVTTSLPVSTSIPVSTLKKTATKRDYDSENKQHPGKGNPKKRSHRR